MLCSWSKISTVLIIATLGLCAHDKAQSYVHARVGDCFSITSQSITLPMSYNALTGPSPTLNVSINGSRALTFVLDTGLNVPVLLEEWAAKELKLTDGPAASMEHVNRGPDVMLTLLAASRDLDAHLEDIPSFISHIPDQGVSKLLGGTRIAGTIGLPALRVGSAKLDFARHQLTLFPDQNGVVELADSVSLPLQLTDGLAFVPIGIGSPDSKRSVQMILDTGSNHTALPTSIAEDLGQSKKSTICSALADGSLLLGCEVRLAEIRLGSYKEPNVDVELRSTDTGILGMDVLARYSLTFDFPKKRILIQHAPNYASLCLPHGDAGLEFTLESGAKVVKTVKKESGAYIAGVQPGDQIVAVNGSPIDTASYYTVKRLLAGPEDTHVKLTIKRGGRTLPPIDIQLKSVYSDKGSVLDGVALRKLPNGMLIVISVVESGRAWKSGLREQDTVMKANGKEIDSLGPEELYNLFCEESVSLEIKPADGKPIKRLILGGK